MEIAIGGFVLDTKDIVDIVDIEHNKKMFLNRQAGFIIKFKNNTQKHFGESIPYDSYPSEIGRIKEKWYNLKKQVVKKWESDKNEIQNFTV